jgi:hypothetical protein
MDIIDEEEEAEEVGDLMLALANGNMRISNNEAYAEAIANFVRTLFDKLVEKCFSEDVALQIIAAVTSQGTQLVGNR